MTTTTNFDKVLLDLEALLNDVLKKEVTFQVANGMLAPVKERIHSEGKAGDGSEIGQYKNTYLNYRLKQNRTSDTKIILSLTRQMENDFSVQAVGQNAYGLGYNNEENYNKAKYNDKRWNKEIFVLTKEEEEKAVQIAKKAFLDAFT